MSVLIRGMEMPPPGTGRLIIFDDFVAIYIDAETGERKEYEARPIPPHGRLIDADALRAEVKKHSTPSDAWVFSLIRTAPTVIEAEEARDGSR